LNIGPIRFEQSQSDFSIFIASCCKELCAANSAVHHNALCPCVLKQGERSQARAQILPDEGAATGAYIAPSKPIGGYSRYQRIAAGGPTIGELGEYACGV
jgi:hypothetical protein